MVLSQKHTDHSVSSEYPQKAPIPEYCTNEADVSGTSELTKVKSLSVSSGTNNALDGSSLTCSTTSFKRAVRHARRSLQRYCRARDKQRIHALETIWGSTKTEFNTDRNDILQRFQQQDAARNALVSESPTLPDNGPHWDDSCNHVPSCETPHHVAMAASTRLYCSPEEKLNAKAARTALHAQRVQTKSLRRQWALENGAQLSPWWHGLMTKPSTLAGILDYWLQATAPAISDFKVGDAVEVMPTYLEFEDLVGRHGVIDRIEDNTANASYGLPLDTTDVAFGDCGCSIPMVHLRRLANGPVTWKKRVGHRTRHKQFKKQYRGSVYSYGSQ